MTLRILLLLLSLPLIVSAQHDLTYFLPAEQYNSEIPTPKSVIGHEVGDYHITHDKLVYYMKTLAAASDRITIRETGKTFEGRPQLVLTITSPQNHARINEIKAAHVAISDEGGSIEGQPVVVYMGFSIHGNEPSGSNASMLTAYYLAASNDPATVSRLNNAVILLDPSFNPDGLQRFASWVNSKRGQLASTDPNNLEQNEPWPRGRTNHYWFDLNRDWLPAQLPESQNRLAVFHEWRPNVLTDHHEMGTNSTFFFQPGIPSRNNPLTPEKTYELTAEIGRHHARALDSIGSLYYTQESFDDFYYGKGSTYPDVNGGIGILFEQASSRGHAQESVNGVLRFPFTIRNQFNTSLSTFRAAVSLKTELLGMQRDFYSGASSFATGTPSGYVVASKDPWRLYRFAEMLGRHRITFTQAKSNPGIPGKKYEASEAIVIPGNQLQARLITSIFEKRTSFTDSLFYDVSAWHMPSAFGLDYNTLDARQLKALTGETAILKAPVGEVVGGNSSYAYALEWKSYYAPAALYSLLDEGLNIKVATAPFTGNDGKAYPRGTIIIPANNQTLSSGEIFEALQSVAEQFGVIANNLPGGLDYAGKSLGSPSMQALRLPKIAIIVGNGVNSYEAGEVWHLFDERMKIPLTLLPIESVSSADLNRYNTIIMVDGSYNRLGENGSKKLKQWADAGGNIIAVKRALRYLSSNKMGNFTFKKLPGNDTTGAKPYSEISPTFGAQQLGGSIFAASIDTTHPLFYGYEGSTLAVFKNDRNFLEPASGSFANPATFTSNPLIAGYISAPVNNVLKNSAVVGVSRSGSGRVIGLAANMNFRAFWYGTNRVFMNAIFFGPIISSRSMR